MLRKSPGVRVEVFDKLGSLMVMAFNFYHPPFDNVKLRRAVLSAVNQQDFVNAVVGEQQNLGRVGVGVFPLASPYATTAGMEALTGPRDLDKSKRLVAESGYKGEPIVLMVPSDQPNLVQEDQVPNALYKSLGLNVQFTDARLGHPAAAPQQPGDAGQGRLDQLLHRLGGPVGREPVHAPAAARQRRGHAGVVAPDRRAPSSSCAISGWMPRTSPRRRRSVTRSSCARSRTVPFIPLGQSFQPTAFRDDLTGFANSPFPVFWGVRRT